MNTNFTFENRSAAGQLLSKRMQDYAGGAHLVVLAIAPGGVPVAREVAQALQATLDVLVYRKLPVPGQPHLTMGVIVSGGARYLNKEVINQTNVTRKQFDTVFNSEIVELQRRDRLYRENQTPVDISYRSVILVDDGATSIEMIRSAAMALRAKHPKRIVAALPVAPADAVSQLGEAIDDFECVYSPHDFQSVDQYYRSFDEVAEKTACELFAQAVRDGHRDLSVGT